MKTILTKADNISRWLCSDETEINLKENEAEIGPANSLECKILDLNSSNAIVVEDVTTSPDDWSGAKYSYIDSVWTLHIIPTPENPNPS